MGWDIRTPLAPAADEGEPPASPQHAARAVTRAHAPVPGLLDQIWAVPTLRGQGHVGG
ncbi:hypothetical protein ACOZ38_19815 [Sphaerisporangium viridialbum]|uniref:hypothetical protein n=1 Tax=Sphaerisporangium viridialbum TaxID=46189 RepID=UPI003C763F12